MTKKSVAIIDYGMGNLHSVASAIEHVAPDANVVVSSDRKVITEADHVIFPGVGAIRDCMAEIRRMGFDQLVPELVDSGKPVLGICVGMQALMGFSEENGGVDCLDMLPGKVAFFGEDLTGLDNQSLKVPHMGWNQVEQRQEHPLWHNIDDSTRFYFVHSYAITCEQSDWVLGRCHYGRDFDVAVARDNLCAVQFHPEKSHTAGLQLLKNFVQWDGR